MMAFRVVLCIFSLAGFSQLAIAAKAREPRASAPAASCEPILTPSVADKAKAVRATIDLDWSGKVVVLDTNVLLTNPNSIFDFPGARIVLSIHVIEEIDKKKVPKPENQNVARNAREVTRVLDRILANYNGTTPVSLANGATLEVDVGAQREGALTAMSPEVMDNKILATALRLNQQANKAGQVVFITQDLNARLKARSMQIVSDDYKPGFNRASIDDIYSGALQLEISDRLYNELSTQVDAGRDLELPWADVWRDLRRLKSPQFEMHPPNPNQFIVFRNKKAEARGEADGDGLHAIVGRYLAVNDKLRLLPAIGDLQVPVLPRNLEQRMAIELLFDNDIDFLFLYGKAGTGKTLYALMGGTEQVNQSPPLYNQMVLIRPMVPTGEDPGALPGGAEEKVEPYLDAYRDNLEFLLSRSGVSSPRAGDQVAAWPTAGRFTPRKGERHGGGRGGEGKRGGAAQGSEANDPRPFAGRRPQSVDAFMGSGKVKIQLLAYVRGRSFVQKYVIIDEAQNLDPGQLKTLVTRAGKGTKFIIMGDISQIDRPYLNRYNNGISDFLARLEGTWQDAKEAGDLRDGRYSLVGVVRLTKGERSEGADLMTELYEGKQ